MVACDDNEDLGDLGEMLRINSRAGGRGDHWHMRGQQEEEVGAAQEVLTTAGHRVDNLRPRERGQDPPDCEAIIDGQRCGVEVCELLHRPTLEASIRGVADQHFVWTPEILCQKIQCLIDRKDCPESIKGGPYDKYFLVIVTDELVLYRENVCQFLEGRTFQTQFITDVYFGLSYHPGPRGGGSYPVFKLILAPRCAKSSDSDIL